MSKNWILDVLADLRIFAGENDLPVLADQLKNAEVIALTELSPLEGVSSPNEGLKDDIEARTVFAAAGSSLRPN